MATKQRFAKVTKNKSPYDAAAARENNIIGQRIADARKRHRLSLPEFSKLLSNYGLTIKNTGLHKWESGVALPNAYQFLAVCQALGINDILDYFSEVSDLQPELNDEGLKKLAEYKSDLIATGKYRPKAQPKVSKIVYVEKPVSNLSASAGTGEFLEEGNFEMVRFPASTVPEQADFGIRVNGDSMEPVYQDGQIVWVQACKRLTPGDVGIMVYDGAGYIKVYTEQEPDASIRENFIDSNGILHMQPVMVSYNEKYEPKPVSPELSFWIVGRVLN